MTRLTQLWWVLVELSGLRPGFATEQLDDLPDVLEPRRIYLVGDELQPWAAALLCPCDCGATIQLSLIEDDSPRWRAKRHFSGSVTLHPSIWRKRGCRSHFFLRRGRIVWSESPNSIASTPTLRPRGPASFTPRPRPSSSSEAPDGRPPGPLSRMDVPSGEYRAVFSAAPVRGHETDLNQAIERQLRLKRANKRA